VERPLLRHGAATTSKDPTLTQTSKITLSTSGAPRWTIADAWRALAIFRSWTCTIAVRALISSLAEHMGGAVFTWTGRDTSGATNMPASLEKSAKYVSVVVGLSTIKCTADDRCLQLEWKPGSGGQPPVAFVPDRRLWDVAMPNWARGRREEIMSTVRARTAYMGFTWQEFGGRAK
jgi:hypothetical protein